MNAFSTSVMTRATSALTLPYFTWIAGLVVLFFCTNYDAPAFVYAGKTLLCLLLLGVFRPWRFASCKATPNNLIAGILFGIVVCVLWVLPEATPWDRFLNFYRRWFVMMPGTLPDYHASWCYSWKSAPMLAFVKLIGSAFVIAPIEEFFFRGWLMRWLTDRDWQHIPLSAVSRNAFWITALVFAFEHDRFVVGLLAGLVYGILAVRTNSLRTSIIAHITTNLLLGVYVLMTDSYEFW
ncbi:MAG: CAAX prenyl protease-related protein [Kiritimatiellia bacterium]